MKAVIAGLSRFRHCFHRHRVDGEREVGVSGSCVAANRCLADAGSAEAELRYWKRHWCRFRLAPRRATVFLTALGLTADFVVSLGVREQWPWSCLRGAEATESQPSLPTVA